MFVPPAAAGDQYTTWHPSFSAPVQLPGVALPAGTYTFERFMPGIVQVLSRDHLTSYGLFMTIPELRDERTAKQAIVFGEAPMCDPPPIQTWFPFPERTAYLFNKSVGYRFLY